MKDSEIFGAGSGVVKGHDNTITQTGVGLVDIPIGFIPNKRENVRFQMLYAETYNNSQVFGQTPEFTPVATPLRLGEENRFFNVSFLENNNIRVEAKNFHTTYGKINITFRIFEVK